MVEEDDEEEEDDDVVRNRALLHTEMQIYCLLNVKHTCNIGFSIYKLYSYRCAAEFFLEGVDVVEDLRCRYMVLKY